MRLHQEVLDDLGDWGLLCRFLPPGWVEEARKRGALTRARGVADAEALLRILMIHLCQGCSLAETATRAREAGLGDVSAVAVFKRLRAADEWLRWLAERLRAALPGPIPLLQRAVIAADATTVSEPGSTGTDWRVHYAVNLANLQCEFFELTDAQGGETWRRYPIRAGDIVLGDRGYASARGVAYVVERQADVIVRMRFRGFPLEDAEGRKQDVLKLPLSRLRVGKIREWSLSTGVGKEPRIGGRLIVVKRSREVTRRARRHLRRKASRRQEKVSQEAWRAAQYFFVWTTLPPEISAETILLLYRLRWQIELVFKRFKSILGLGHLPKKDLRSARAWLHGKLFVGLLVERIIAAADSFSPWGYPLDLSPQSLERDHVLAS